jgi:hypothetical protein
MRRPEILKDGSRNYLPEIPGAYLSGRDLDASGFWLRDTYLNPMVRSRRKSTRHRDDIFNQPQKIAKENMYLWRKKH